MPTRAYYNENDVYCAAWLRNLIAAGHIAPGDVDERSIKDVRPDDLAGYTQCHFFAGIGVWSYALRCAGWPDDRPVWTGSCPCPSFSVAGKGAGKKDAARHLWPEWLRLISECLPATIFGEQVSAAIGYGWLDDVFISLEQRDYACGAVVFPAASCGAPHIRERLYFVGQSNCAGSQPWRRSAAPVGYGGAFVAASGADGLADSAHTNWRRGERGTQTGAWAQGERRRGLAQSSLASGPVNGFWRDAEWIACLDGKARPVKSGLAPLVTIAASRVGRLRAYGNCITASQATEFIRAYCEVTD
jgi:DNA (cytosine-5)-methyltransferase 1